MGNFLEEMTMVTEDGRVQKYDTAAVQQRVAKSALMLEIEREIMAYGDHLTGTDHMAPVQGHVPAFRL